MKEYVKPELEEVVFQTADIITLTTESEVVEPW